jgi:transposase
MAAWRRAIELGLGEEDTAKLRSIAQSRTEPASRVERARILLAYREDPSFFAVGRNSDCIIRPSNAASSAPWWKARWLRWTIARAQVESLRLPSTPRLGWCRWPAARPRTRLLASHAREHGPAEGHACLTNLAQGTVCKILDQEEVKPHKVRYYLEQRDPDFAKKMAEVLCVYRQVKILKKAAASKKKPDAVAIISYDEKPGIQAIATTAPDLPPEPGAYPTFAREFEYKRYGTVSLLAGIDLVTGKVHALVKDRHRSREFIEFLKLLDAAYPAHTAIKLILDNHSAHFSKETKAWLAEQPAHRFDFTFTPKHGSWLNLIEGFFSKLARSVLRHIRVASKQELKDRIMAAMDFFNRQPVVHTWSFKLDKAA